MLVAELLFIPFFIILSPHRDHEGVSTSLDSVWAEYFKRFILHQKFPSELGVRFENENSLHPCFLIKLCDSKSCVNSASSQPDIQLPTESIYSSLLLRAISFTWPGLWIVFREWSHQDGNIERFWLHCPSQEKWQLFMNKTALSQS